jgi:hypothetical protein
MHSLPMMLQKQCKSHHNHSPYARGRFAAGSTATFPWVALHCCHATSIGAATAIEE